MPHLPTVASRHDYAEVIHIIISVTSLVSAVVCVGATTSLPAKSQTCAPVVFHDTTGLYYLNCSNRGKSEFPQNVSDEVEVLDFSGNSFTELPQIWESASCKRHENHQHCHVANTSNHCRVSISFRNNAISTFHKNWNHNLRCLSRLDLSQNGITADILGPQTFMEGYQEVRQLNLSHNPLHRLPGNSISSTWFKSLLNLDLSHCRLTDLDKDAVDDHTEMTSLNLSHNVLSTIHPRTFKGLAKLTVLDLGWNKLTYIADTVFADLLELRSLDLSHNSIRWNHIQDNAFYNDSNIRFLDLSYNQIEHIPYGAIRPLGRLDTLILSHNPILTISANQVKSPAFHLLLDYLDDLSTLEEGAFYSFPKLQSLSVSNCKNLHSIHINAIGASMLSLTSVHLHNNRLTTLSRDALPWSHRSHVTLHGNPWFCDMRISWMKEIRFMYKYDEVICTSPAKLQGYSIRNVTVSDLGQYYSPVYMTGVVLVAVLIPLLLVCVWLGWRRRHHCTCVTAKVRGRYVSVFTRDMDACEEESDSVNIELRVNVNNRVKDRLRVVSHGGPDDTKSFVKYEDRDDDDEEEI